MANVNLIDGFWANEIINAIKRSRTGYIWGQQLMEYMLGGFAQLVAEKKVAVDAAGNIAIDRSKLPCAVTVNPA